jgi:hypothetical protein
MKMKKSKSLKSAGVLQILGLYSQILEELCDRGVLKTVNNPAADYAEHLCCCALSLHPAPNSTKGFDATDSKRKRYEIKARRRTRRSQPTRFSAIRKLKENHFDYLIAVVFAEDFTVERATVFPRKAILEKAFWQEHVNGWILPLDDNLWQLPGARNITKRLRRVQLGAYS